MCINFYNSTTRNAGSLYFSGLSRNAKYVYSSWHSNSGCGINLFLWMSLECGAYVFLKIMTKNVLTVFQDSLSRV
jgi:hypothetical protein